MNEYNLIKAVQDLRLPSRLIWMFSDSAWYGIPYAIAFICPFMKGSTASGLWLAWVVSVRWIGPIKLIFGRDRPTDGIEGICVSDVASGTSWPSGHVMLCAAFWAVLSNGVTARRKIVLLIGVTHCLLASFSRVWLGAHFPSDVIGGYAIGTVVGIGLHKLAKQTSSIGQLSVVHLGIVALALANSLGFHFGEDLTVLWPDLCVLSGLATSLIVFTYREHLPHFEYRQSQITNWTLNVVAGYVGALSLLGFFLSLHMDYWWGNITVALTAAGGFLVSLVRQDRDRGLFPSEVIVE